MQYKFLNLTTGIFILEYFIENLGEKDEKHGLYNDGLLLRSLHGLRTPGRSHAPLSPSLRQRHHQTNAFGKMGKF